MSTHIHTQGDFTCDAASGPDGVLVVVVAALTQALLIERSRSVQSQKQAARLQLLNLSGAEETDGVRRD